MSFVARTGVSPWALLVLALGCIGVGFLSGINPEYGLLAAGGTMFAAVVVMDLTVGFVLFTALSFLDLLNVSGSFSGTKLIGLMLFVSYLARISTRRVADASSFVRDNPGLVVAMVALLSWSLLSFTWAQSPSTALGGTGRFALNMLLIPIAYAALRERQHVLWVVVAFTVGAVFSAVFGFLNPSTSSIAGFGSRATGSVGDPNAQAAVLVASIPLLIALLGVYRGSARARIAVLTSLVIVVVGLIQTQSRGGFVSLGVMMLAAVLVGGRWRKRVAVLLVLGAAATFAYYSLVVPPESRQRVSSTDTSGRTTLWTVALRVFDAHPLRGVGTDNFILVEGQYVNEPGAVTAFYVVDSPKVAHNAYLEVLVDLGIPGLLAFVAILVCAGGATVRAVRLFSLSGDEEMELVSRALVLTIVAVSTSEFFISAQYGRYLWLPLSLGPVLLGMARRAQAPTPDVVRLEPAAAAA